MGYRLYQRGSIIRFTAEAFSVHWSHKSAISETDKLAGSMRNFERLFEKHPDMALVARRWALDTYGKLKSWAEWIAVDLSRSEVRARLDARFQSEFERRHREIAPGRRNKRPLRILSYRWHVPHQYELQAAARIYFGHRLARSLGQSMEL